MQKFYDIIIKTKIYIYKFYIVKYLINYLLCLKYTHNEY